MLVLALFSLVFSKTYKCGCLPASPNDQTSWGQQNVIITNDKLVKSLRGKVLGLVSKKPLAGVLVEVLDNPEGLLLDWRARQARKSSQHRLAACVTGADGEFCFPKIPAGKYELRCSKPIEWNSTSVYVIVAPKDPHSTKSKMGFFFFFFGY